METQTVSSKTQRGTVLCEFCGKVHPDAVERDYGSYQCPTVPGWTFHWWEDDDAYSGMMENDFCAGSEVMNFDITSCPRVVGTPEHGWETSFMFSMEPFSSDRDSTFHDARWVKKPNLVEAVRCAEDAAQVALEAAKTLKTDLYAKRVQILSQYRTAMHDLRAQERSVLKSSLQAGEEKMGSKTRRTTREKEQGR